MMLSNAGTVLAQNSINTWGWTQETDAGVGAAVAAGSNNTQMVLTTDGQVWAEGTMNLSRTGWTQEAPPGTAEAIAVGGNTQMMLSYAGTVLAQNSINTWGWYQETDAGVGTEISVGNSGTQMVLTNDGQVWAEGVLGNHWTQEAPPGTAQGISG